MKVKMFIFIFLLTLFSGCATVREEVGVRDLYFFHDRNRGDVKFICWREHNVTGWKCQRTLDEWERANSVIKTWRKRGIQE